MKKVCSLLLLTTTMLLSGCGTSTSLDSATSSDTPVVEIDSLKSALLTMKQDRNFTYDVSYRGVKDGTYSITPTKAEYIETYTGNYHGFIADGNGVYSIEYDDYTQGSISSEYILDTKGQLVTSIYEAGLIGSFESFDTNTINSIGTNNTYEVQNKVDKFATLLFVGLDSTSILDLNKAVFSFDSTSGVKLVLNMKSGSDYTVLFSKIGTTTTTEVDLFLQYGGTVFEVDENLAEVRRLIGLDNYIRTSYDFYNVDEETGKNPIAGYELYNENYFLGQDDVTYAPFSNVSGNVGINAPSYGLVGSYYVSGIGSVVTDIYSTPLTIYTTQPNFTVYNIPAAYNYPSLMKTWSKLQYFHHEQLEEGEGLQWCMNEDGYVTFNQEIAYEISTNFALNTLFDFEEYPPIAVSIDYDLYSDDKDSEVIICCFFQNGDQAFYCELPLWNFGNSKSSVCESFLNTHKE